MTWKAKHFLFITCGNNTNFSSCLVVTIQCLIWLEKYNGSLKGCTVELLLEDRDGRQINIWEDWQLPTPNTFRVVLLRNPQSAANYVCDLLDENTKTRRKIVLDRLFMPQEAAVIQSIF
nr:hypothetical protein CFP56_77569 [Quercus suber]